MEIKFSRDRLDALYHEEKELIPEQDFEAGKAAAIEWATEYAGAREMKKIAQMEIDYDEYEDEDGADVMKMMAADVIMMPECFAVTDVTSLDYAKGFKAGVEAAYQEFCVQRIHT